jgi:hypothetical protein
MSGEAAPPLGRRSWALNSGVGSSAAGVQRQRIRRWKWCDSAGSAADSGGGGGEQDGRMIFWVTV